MAYLYPYHGVHSSGLVKHAYIILTKYVWQQPGIDCSEQNISSQVYSWYIQKSYKHGQELKTVNLLLWAESMRLNYYSVLVGISGSS